MSDSGQKRTAASFELTIGGKTFTQPESNGLESFTLEDHVDMMAMLSVRLSGGEGSPEWGVKIGDKVEAKVGQGQNIMFTGEVIAVEPSFTPRGGATLNVRCYDNTHRLGRGRKTKFWTDMKDSDVAQEVAKEANLQVDVDPTENKWPYILQRNESNIAFLKRLAARNNFQVTVRDGKLLFKKSDTAGQNTEIEMGESLRSLSMNFNSTEQASKVVVRGWDVRTKKEIVGTATSSDSAGIGSGQKGADLASSSFGDQTVYITDIPVTDQDQANMIAKAEFQRISRQFGRGQCTADGNDQLRAGAMVSFKGIAKGYNGKYYIVSSRHMVSSHTGYIVEFQFCSDTMGD